MSAPGQGNSVLLAEDDLSSRLATRLFLQRMGYEVGEAADGPAALREISLQKYDIVLLDLAMPGIDGENVLIRLRRDSTVPVIVLTGRAEEAQRVRILDIGADDYVVKPFSLPELEARIRAVLRRGRQEPIPDRIEHQDLLIDRDAHRVEVAGREVDLTPKEFDLLAFLASSPGKVFTREELLERVWGSTQEWQDPATVTEHVRRLRLKIEPLPAGPRWLETVRGVGYRFAPSSESN
ncbi:MAG: response regulator transcription factor [Acidimicrobiales bacterium]|jgi:DNA-binding response OmpR family regulator|nr:response regulator transcription factor [Actinomycetota bacterium]